MERWLSGRRHTLGKRAMRKRIRGFESPSLRHNETDALCVRFCCGEERGKRTILTFCKKQNV